MTGKVFFLIAVHLLQGVTGFSSAHVGLESLQAGVVGHRRKVATSYSVNESNEGCHPCHEVEDPEVDRREAIFSSIGAIVGALSIRPAAANAAYGQEASIELPNVIEGFSKRFTEQCMVETLGSRDCLVYFDPSNRLYQGADAQILLKRMEASSAALAEIPALIDSKKWSAINGILTGPMGTLVSTMDLLVKLSENGKKPREMVKQVKADLVDISQAAGKKQGEKALQAQSKATRDLVSFLESL